MADGGARRREMMLTLSATGLKNFKTIRKPKKATLNPKLFFTGMKPVRKPWERCR